MPHEDHGMMATFLLVDIDTFNNDYVLTHQSPIESNIESSIPYSSNEPEESIVEKGCELLVNGTEKVAITIIDSIDVETRIFLFVHIFGNAYGDCYIGFLAAIQMRPGGVDNGWIATGFGGSYTNNTNNVEMNGDSIIWIKQIKCY